MSREERTGFRDIEFSLRHRTFGRGLNMIDLDCGELRGDEPVALIDVKTELAKIINGDFSDRAYGNFAKGKALPYFRIIRRLDFSKYVIQPRNDLARKWFRDAIEISEREYIEFLSDLRGINLSEEVLTGEYIIEYNKRLIELIPKLEAQLAKLKAWADKLLRLECLS